MVHNTILFMKERGGGGGDKQKRKKKKTWLHWYTAILLFNLCM